MNILDVELKQREKDEAKDAIDAVFPPDDIVAFNELRSCADLYRLYKKDQLDIKPEFQRGIVWSTKAQSLFVDSLIKQLPIPSLCISLNFKNQRRMVIDGLQRLWTIIHFLDYEKEDWSISKSNDLDPRISGKMISAIAADSTRLFDIFENVTIPITVLRCDYDKPNHMAYLFQIFHRLNSGGCKLLNQEIRNCIYQGSLNNFLKEFVVSPSWLSFTKSTPEKIRAARFGNEERILRFLAMYDSWNSYSGNLAQFLNNYMQENKNMSEDNIRKRETLLIQTIAVVERIDITSEILKNKNLMEGIFIGVSQNIDFLINANSEKLNNKFKDLLKTIPYSTDIREGMAHTSKVTERISTAIHTFGPENEL